MYKIIFEHVQDLDNVAKIRIILNPQIRLLFAKRANCNCNNLLITNEVAIIISNQYNRYSF